MGSGLFVHGEAVALELAEGHRGHFHHHVDPAGQHLGGAGVGVGDGAEDDRLKLGRAVPVVGIGLDHHGLVGPPLGEGEGAGPRRVAAEV